MLTGLLNSYSKTFSEHPTLTPFSFKTEGVLPTTLLKKNYPFICFTGMFLEKLFLETPYSSCCQNSLLALIELKTLSLLSIIFTKILRAIDVKWYKCQKMIWYNIFKLPFLTDSTKCSNCENIVCQTSN